MSLLELSQYFLTLSFGLRLTEKAIFGPSRPRRAENGHLLLATWALQMTCQLDTFNSCAHCIQIQPTFTKRIKEGRRLFVHLADRHAQAHTRHIGEGAVEQV